MLRTRARPKPAQGVVRNDQLINQSTRHTIRFGRSVGWEKSRSYSWDDFYHSSVFTYAKADDISGAGFPRRIQSPIPLENVEDNRLSLALGHSPFSSAT